MVDAVRGLAVLAMIEWHTADAWLGGAAREGSGFVIARFVGGLAAPAFLFLAGMSLALAAPERPSAARTWASVRRGARIVLAGYGLSLFAWVVDHGGVLHRANLPAIVALSLAIALGAFALDDRARTIGVRAGLALAALAAAELGAQRLAGTTRGGASLVERIDVLHGIGAALASTALALHFVRGAPRGRAIFLGAIAIAIAACAFPLVGVPQQILPEGIARWIARGGEGASGFPLFPWLAYALLGASIALAIRSGSMELEHRYSLPAVRSPMLVAIAAFTLAAAVWEPMPLARAVLDHVGEIRSLFRLVFNAAVIAFAAALVAALAPRAFASTLALLGRHSLAVYCAHLEIAYGLAGVPLRRSLSFNAWALGLAIVVVAMLALSRALDHRSRRARRTTATLRGALESTDPHVS